MIEILIVCPEGMSKSTRDAFRNASGFDPGEFGSARWLSSSGEPMSCIAFNMPSELAVKLHGEIPGAVTGFGPDEAWLVDGVGDDFSIPKQPVVLFFGVLPEIGLSLLGLQKMAMDTILA